MPTVIAGNYNPIQPRQPNDIINGALRSIGALAAGEVPPPQATNDAFLMLNDLLDLWSNNHMAIFCEQEVILELTSAQSVYSFGPNGQIGCVFTGSCANGVLTVTDITSGALSVGQVINNSALPPNSIITSYGTATGGNSVSALGTYNISTTIGLSSGSITTYAPRPLRISSAFVRVATLDYPVAILNKEEYELIGLKRLNGPWPRALYYQPSFPNGTLFFWPNPAQGEMHMYCDTVLNQFYTANDTVALPQGYFMALRWNLAKLMCPEYGKQVTPEIEQNARESLSWIKRNNMNPLQVSRFDDVLSNRRQKDAGWILRGGF